MADQETPTVRDENDPNTWPPEEVSSSLADLKKRNSQQFSALGRMGAALAPEGILHLRVGLLMEAAFGPEGAPSRNLFELRFENQMEQVLTGALSEARQRLIASGRITPESRSEAKTLKLK